ncbi:MAG: hypothetical protein IPL71_03855 [Anaerolineales bacterium]|uniref:hypothetical protein n=1 Tax=Candidatus Villigracilis proximus TaxID=3140683 RepID=UPI003136B598|nr:hypothetical protein [Anaerolineales bacterium]
MNKKNILTVSIVVVIAVLGFMAYRQVAAKKAAAVESSATETAVVERSDLSMTVDASVVLCRVLKLDWHSQQADGWRKRL